MPTALKVWLAPLLDEGAATAVYPYAQLREILTPGDCRRAVLDETQPLEVEFGQALVRPLYDLLWSLNCGAGVFTSHTVVAPPNHQPPVDWAKSYVAAATIILSRNQREHYDQSACAASVDELARIISASAPTHDATGWHLSVGPCNVIFTRDMAVTTFRSFLAGDTKGYGCQLVIGGAANSRRTAAIRWSQAVTFVNNAIQRTQHLKGTTPAAPHRHTIPGALPEAENDR
jgi:hypothetical protein